MHIARGRYIMDFASGPNQPSTAQPLSPSVIFVKPLASMQRKMQPNTIPSCPMCDSTLPTHLILVATKVATLPGDVEMARIFFPPARITKSTGPAVLLTAVVKPVQSELTA